MLSANVTVLSASSNIMTSKLSGLLPLSPLLSHTAQRAFVLNDLCTSTLVSLTQICDDDCCTAIFLKKDGKIVKNHEIIINGTMDYGPFPFDPSYIQQMAFCNSINLKPS